MGLHAESNSLMGRLKRVVKKISLIVTTGFNYSQWCLASLILRGSASNRRKWRLSFNDRLGLKYEPAEEEEEKEEMKEENKSVREIRRRRSYRNNPYEDIDERAEIFIKKFRQQLLQERLDSLRLRYLRENGSLGNNEEEDQ